MFGQTEDRYLNEDELLEDEDLFEGPISPNEVPEIRSDLKIIASVESDLMGIQYLLKDINTLGGMNQEIALEAASYSDEIKNTNIKFFTKEPTVTNLAFAQESLIESIKRGFKKIYEIIRGWIKRLVAWITGSKKSNVTDSDYEKAKHDVAVNDENTDKAWTSIIRDLDQVNEDLMMLNKEPEFLQGITQDGEIPEVYRFTVNLLYKFPRLPVNRILESEDPFVYDIILMGPYIRFIKDIVSKLPNVSMQLIDKVKTLDQIYTTERKVSDSPSDRLLGNSLMKTVEQPIYYLMDDKKYSSEELISNINRLRERTRGNRSNTKVQYPELVLRLFTNTNELDIKAMSRAQYQCVTNLIGIENEISKLQSLDEKIMYGEEYSKGNDRFVSDLRTAVSKVSTEVNLLTIVLRYIKMTLDQLFYMCRDTAHFNDSLLDWVVSEGKIHNVVIPKDIHKAVLDSKIKRKTNYVIYSKYVKTNPF